MKVSLVYIPNMYLMKNQGDCYYQIILLRFSALNLIIFQLLVQAKNTGDGL